jgi:hypothetical protein
MVLAIGGAATGGLDSITLSGTSGSLIHSTSLGLTVTAYHFPRSRWVRTDASTIYPFVQIQNQNWLVFDPNTNRIFEADPVSNRIMVVDDVTQTKTGEIIVPGAFGIDLSPDGSTLWVGTLIGDVYAIDPAKMAVTHRYPAGQIGPKGFQAVIVLAMANGKIALRSVYGSGTFGIWNPSDNSIVIHGDGSSTSAGCADSQTGPSLFERTGDRSLLIFLLGSNTLCTFDPVTGQGNSSNIQGYPAASTPDGKSILVLEWGPPPSSLPQIAVLDSRTLAQEQTIPVALGLSDTTAMIASADSKAVYVAGYLVYTYDLASGQLLGWAPNPYVGPYGGGMSSGPAGPPIFEAQDNNGFLVGPMQEGVGFFDTQALRTGPPPGSGMLNDYVTPGTGPSSGGTSVKLGAPSNLAEIVFVQPNRSPAIATGIQVMGTESQWQSVYSAVTPLGAPGVADIYGLGQDGSLQFVPEGFSYGPTILEATPNSATADGGGTGGLYGYGFGPGLEISTSAIPSDLQVTVGGKPASITSFSPSSYGMEGPPFQLMGFAFTIPAGPAGSSEDITVTTLAGMATLKNGITYLPSAQEFPLNGAALAQGVYDSTREHYYFTDASQIQVFSRIQSQWLNPIPVPAAPQGTTHRLWAIALSPDGSKLAVTDTGTKAVYLIDPGTGTVASFSVAGDIPYGVYVSDVGIIYVAGNNGFYKIDTNLGTLLTYSVPSMSAGIAKDPQIRSMATADTSHVYFNSQGLVFDIDTAADTVSATQTPACCNNGDEFAFSSDNSRFLVSGYLCDSNLNPESYLSMNLRESFGITYVNGAKLSPDGTLVFAPSPNSIDVFDGRLGILLRRIALPVTLSQNYDALVSDGKDSVLVAITGQTGNGVAVIDLSSIPEPAPLPYSTATQGPSRISAAGNDTRARSAPKGHGIPPALKYVTN